MSVAPDITQSLRAARTGDASAVDRLFPLVYGEMKRLAQAHLAHERPDHTLQATAVVHEAYLRMVDQRRTDWHDRNHFFAIAAQAMRRVLVDHARRRARQKRGGGRARVTLTTAMLSSDPESSDDLVALEEALDALQAARPLAARVVELRFYGGLTHEEAADVLGVSERTARNHWEYARAWLFRRLAAEC